MARSITSSPARDNEGWRRETDPSSIFRRQEITLIKINLMVLAALYLIHVAFGPTIGYPRRLVFILLSLRFIEQAIELRWLQHLKAPLHPVFVRHYRWISPAITLVHAHTVTVLGLIHDAHYNVLMVVAVVAAAFRLRLSTTLIAAGVASAFTFQGVWFYFLSHPPFEADEFFEASTMSLVYFVVAIVAWLLNEHMRRDAQELKITRERLSVEERLGAIGRMASAIAHEIRNPVAAISSSLAAARREDLADEVREEMGCIAAQELKRLEKLTTDFLSYARIQPPKLEATSLSTALEYVCSLVSARAAEASVKIVTCFPRRLAAKMDEFQIHGAILNLLMNAIDACPAGGTIRVGVHPAASGAKTDFIRIFVENPGSPISAENTAKIFEPFFTTKSSGTGLGLAIARNIAIAHGGNLRLTLNGGGRVRFELFLPDRPISPAEMEQVCPDEEADESLIAPSAIILEDLHGAHIGS